MKRRGWWVVAKGGPGDSDTQLQSHWGQCSSCRLTSLPHNSYSSGYSSSTVHSSVAIFTSYPHLLTIPPPTPPSKYCKAREPCILISVSGLCILIPLVRKFFWQPREGHSFGSSKVESMMQCQVDKALMPGQSPP